MKKIIILGFLLFLAFNTLFAQATDDQIRQAANTLGVPYADLRQFVQSYKTNTSPSANVIVIDAVTLHRDYQANRVKADMQYKGKTLRITGVIYEIEKDIITGENCVNLTVSSSIYTGDTGWVSVYFRPTELSKIANLRIGQKVTFIGIGDSGSYYIEKIKDAILATD